jgi:hypothetical protein
MPDNDSVRSRRYRQHKQGDHSLCRDGCNRRRLVAVATGATVPALGRPLTVTQAAKSGDRRDLLLALRDRVARSVEDSRTPPRDLAALSRRLLDIAREVEAIDAKDPADAVAVAAATPDEEWGSDGRQ